MLSLAKKKALVGLDIGSAALKAVELRSDRKKYTVTAFSWEPVPRDSIVDGAIVDPCAVADSLRRLFERQPFTTTDVAASLSGSAVIVKKVVLPAMSAKELAESIRWEAELHIPFDIQDVHVDYQVLASRTTRQSNGTMEVLLVAAKKDKVAGYTNLIVQAGRVPVIVDVDAFALQNAYELNYRPFPGTVVALVNAGASVVNINILNDGRSLFSRDISVGGNAYTEAIQKESSVPFERAERAKKGEAQSGMTLDEIRPVIQAITHTVLLEIQKTFDFFKATSSCDRIDRIMLSGGASLTQGFAQALEDRFGVPVEFFDPFRNIAFEAGTVGIDDLPLVSPTAAVAVGLALRRAVDR